MSREEFTRKFMWGISHFRINAPRILYGLRLSKFSVLGGLLPTRVSRILRLKRIEHWFRQRRQARERDNRDAVVFGSYLTIHNTEARRRLYQMSGIPGDIALVTPLPPEDTGVATFSFKLAQEAAGRIDLFSTFQSPSDYYGTLAKLGGVCELFPLEILPLAALERRYSKVIFAIANSSHLPPIAERLLSFRRLEMNIPIVAHVHDPVLFNLARRTFRSNVELARAFALAYPRLGDAEPSRLHDAALLDSGVTGFSALFRNAVDHIVVHSRAAHDLLEKDLKEVHRPPISCLSHPVFQEPKTGRSFGRPLKRPVLGCFGVPGKDKYSAEVLEAALELHKDGTIGTFIVAGFEANRVAKSLPRGYSPDILVFDAPSDAEFLHLMQQVDVAVQLRRHNRGESSGVIPQLLNLNKAVVTTKVGSFADYEGLVFFCDQPVTSGNIKQAVIQALANKDDSQRKDAVERYVDSHRPSAFLEAIGSLGSITDPARLSQRRPSQQLPAKTGILRVRKD